MGNNNDVTIYNGYDLLKRHISNGLRFAKKPEFCTCNNEKQGLVVHKNFEEAFEAYRAAGSLDGKTLGFTIGEDKLYILTWFDAKEEGHKLFICESLERHFESVLTPYDIDELGKKLQGIKSILQKENACIWLNRTIKSIVECTVGDIQKGNFQEKWIGRAVSINNPRDYFEVQLECDDGKQMLEMKLWTVKSDTAIDLQKATMNIVDLKSDWSMYFDKAFKDMAKTIASTIEKGDFDLNVPSFYNAFSLYSLYGPGTIFEHEQLLEEMNDISEDIKNTGFKPTEKLVNNIREFSKTEGRNYTLKELAELNKSISDFKDNPRQQVCFEAIVKECQEQEMQKTSFMKMQMQMEQVQTLE